MTAASLLAGRGDPWPLLARHAAWIVATAGPRTLARHGDDTMAAKSDRDTGAPKHRRKPSPGPGAPTPPERSRATEPSEDFAERKDIETADEPKDQHDRRHHARDVESVPPA